MPNWGEIEEKLRALGSENSFDTLILVVASPTNINGGLGLYVRGHVSSVLRLSALVAIVDGKTGKPIVTKPLASIHEGLPGTIARSGPRINVPRDLVLAQLSSLDEKTTAKLQGRIIDLPKNQWRPTVQALFGISSK